MAADIGNIIHLDTDVLIDVLADRTPYAVDSNAVWEMVERKHYVGTIAALSVANAAYLLRKMLGSKGTRKCIPDLCRLFTILSCDERCIRTAAAGSISDFGDALQYAAAEQADATAIITRNVRDYPRKGIPILTPVRFLAQQS